MYNSSQKIQLKLMRKDNRWDKLGNFWNKKNVERLANLSLKIWQVERFRNISIIRCQSKIKRLIEEIVSWTIKSKKWVWKQGGNPKNPIEWFTLVRKKNGKTSILA